MPSKKVILWGDSRGVALVYTLFGKEAATTARSVPVPAKDFLTWAAARAIVLDDCYWTIQPRLVFNPFRAFARSWVCPDRRSVHFLESVLNAIPAWQKCYLWCRNGSWVLATRSEGDVLSARVYRGACIPEGWQGAIQFQRPDLAAVLALMFVHRAFGRRTRDEVFLVPDHAKQIIAVPPDDMIWTHFAAKEDVGPFVQRMAACGYDPLPVLPEFKPQQGMPGSSAQPDAAPHDTMSALAQDALRMSLMLHFGLADGVEVVRWADSQIIALDSPPASLIELSTTRTSQIDDLLSHLRALASGANFWAAWSTMMGPLRDYLTLRPERAADVGSQLKALVSRADLWAALTMTLSSLQDYLYSLEQDRAFDVGLELHQTLPGDAPDGLRFLYFLYGFSYCYSHAGIQQKAVLHWFHSELKKFKGEVQHGAAPNGGLATPVGNSRVIEGPPSAS
jgi:hypothetical protein